MGTKGEHVAAYHHSGITVVTQHATEREKRERDLERGLGVIRNREREGRCWFPCGAHEWVGCVGFHTVCMNRSKNTGW